jgi:hypothetical protein
MKFNFTIPRYSLFILLFGLLVFQSGCTEEPEPNAPPVVEDPVAEDPVTEDPVADPDDDIDVNALFSLIQGKWIFGERDRSNSRVNSKHRRSPLGLGKSDFSSARLMDDYQGFIEFLSDTTYIFNDPKVLQGDWEANYSKFQMDFDNKKIILEGLGEIEILEIEGNEVKFVLDKRDSPTNLTLVGVKRSPINDTQRTRFITQFWEIDNVDGVDAIEENFEIEIDGTLITPDGFGVLFTPSGTLAIFFLKNDLFYVADVGNWSWAGDSETFFRISYDFEDQSTEFDDEFYWIKILDLSESSFVFSQTFLDDDFNPFDEIWTLKPLDR